MKHTLLNNAKSKIHINARISYYLWQYCVRLYPKKKREDEEEDVFIFWRTHIEQF